VKTFISVLFIYSWSFIHMAPWLTSKRVARFCQHQLSFLYSNELDAVTIQKQEKTSPDPHCYTPLTLRWWNLW